jgi:hypothetical protein
MFSPFDLKKEGVFKILKKKFFLFKNGIYQTLSDPRFMMSFVMNIGGIFKVIFYIVNIYF